ncbi:type II toxin-antitoxin system Phd/YefM family antitoxin [Algoriphagus sp. A40]|uniref:type II toxin-antitoxin system Phd/YefM family antitoxin n=1 Tax=Algoriphagus sp. A40 TaxID=1945863 RepID=UPI00098792F9|nr:type II toxin-antitoxin system Phd/YefM family antitoxin [Algoriphagus sp. A40]OOG69393.1 prevent-host-death protein [Algoriphagus sp. A40]
MLVISSKEFRDNQKKYFDLVDQNQQVIVQRGKDKSYVLVPISEEDRFFLDPKVIEEVQEGMAEYKTGKVTKVKKTDLDQLLGV